MSLKPFSLQILLLKLRMHFSILLIFTPTQGIQIPRLYLADRQMRDGVLQDTTHLGEQHEGVVCPEVLGEELHAVTLQGWDSVLLGRVQRGHHGLGPYLDLIRIQKPVV